MQSCQSTTPYIVTHIWGDLRNLEFLSSRIKGFLYHIRHPQPLRLHWREEPPKHLSLKISEAYVPETQKAVKILKHCTQRAHKQIPLVQGPVQKQQLQIV